MNACQCYENFHFLVTNAWGFLKEYEIDLTWQHIITSSVRGTWSCTFEREHFVVRGSRFPDDEDRDGPRNVGLFAIEPPDAVDNPKIIY